MASAPFDRTPAADDPEGTAALGFDPEALTELVRRARRDVDDGFVPSCQIALAREGRVAFTCTLGDADPDSRYAIFSATKPMIAGAMWILIGDGLDVTRPVTDFVPGFGTNGKDVVTVEQVMLHTSGFPHAPFSPLDWDDPDRRAARFAKWRLNWEPGTRFEYHPTSAHWVLAAIIESVTGTDFRAFVRGQLIDPLGLEGYELGVAPDRHDTVNELVATGEPATPEELQAALGISELPLTEVTQEALLMFNRPEVRAVGVPGGGGVSHAVDLALYYQAILHNPLGTWRDDVLADVTTRVRNTYPDYVGVAANRTRGLVVAGDDGRANVRGMGRTVSPRAFGHNGAGGQIAWADPDTGVSFVYLTNGLDQHRLREWRRTSALASRAGVCVSG